MTEKSNKEKSKIKNRFFLQIKKKIGIQINYNMEIKQIIR